jgi:hypothetical protein
MGSTLQLLIVPNAQSKKSASLMRPEDTGKWDHLVELHPRGSIYHLSGWARALEAAFPHIKSNPLVLLDEKSASILAGLPLYLSRNLFGKTKLVSVPFALQGDALASSIDEVGTLYEAAFEVYRQKNSYRMEIRSTSPHPHLETLEFGASTGNNHHYLSLDRPPEKLRSSFHKNAVQVPIRKALNSKIELRRGTELVDLIDFYNIFYESRKRAGLPQILLQFFTSLLKSLVLDKQLDILIATLNGMAIGASLLLKYKDTVIIEYGCDIVEYRKLCTNHFLDWSAIKIAYEEGYKILSFGRTSGKNVGLTTYKDRWGTTAEPLYMYHYPKEEDADGSIREKSSFYKATRTVLQKCPDLLYRYLSKIIYKQIQ